MAETLALGALLAALLAVLAAVLFTLRTVHWGATEEERAAAMPGDEFLAGDERPRVVMTRAITIRADAATVWPWVAQLGRGAGWCSYDRLDNGGRPSARHVVSWIPEPRLGDATPIGYLRHLAPGTELTWATDEARFCGSTTRFAMDFRVTPLGADARLVTRISADARGGLPRVLLSLFRFFDSVMARRQLLGIRERVERHGARTSDPDRPETGARDQYQLYEVIYASGERAGLAGREDAGRWHRTAVDSGLTSGSAEPSAQ